MSYSSDEFDSEIRGLLYEVRDRIEDNLRPDPATDDLLGAVESAIHWADDYRIELLDKEDEEEERAMAEDAPYQIADAKLAERKDEDHDS